MTSFAVFKTWVSCPSLRFHKLEKFRLPYQVLLTKNHCVGQDMAADERVSLLRSQPAKATLNVFRLLRNIGSSSMARPFLSMRNVSVENVHLRCHNLMLPRLRYKRRPLLVDFSIVSFYRSRQSNLRVVPTSGPGCKSNNKFPCLGG